jgi:redox-sensitive bicupin YhaK (pirin superfamily)
VRVIAGNMSIQDSERNMENYKGIASTFTPVELYDVRFKEEGNIQILIPENYTTIVLVTEGKIIMNGKELVTGDIAYLTR